MLCALGTQIEYSVELLWRFQLAAGSIQSSLSWNKRKTHLIKSWFYVWYLMIDCSEVQKSSCAEVTLFTISPPGRRLAFASQHTFADPRIGIHSAPYLTGRRCVYRYHTELSIASSTSSSVRVKLGA